MWKIENVFLNITEFVSRFTYLILLILLTYGCQSLKKLRSVPSSPVLLRLGLPSEIPLLLFVAPASIVFVNICLPGEITTYV